MKKFEFRLASVLRVRDTQLVIEENKLQQLFAERAKLENNLLALTEQRITSASWVQGISSPTSADLRALSAFLLGSKARETTIAQAIESCGSDIEEQRRRVILAERNLELLLKLKTRKKAEWQHAFDQELETIAQEAWQSASRSKQRP